MQNFIGLYELLNALLTVSSEMLPFSGNNQNIKMFGVPPNTFSGRSDGVFWWFPALSEDQEKICWIHQNYLVALTWIKPAQV